eukprot:gnl/TRDRNA2_/TRDRNA2_179117_c0_seq1.p1 gnl/TRDRNA2_/TRDRNA2_179117_c0~~gnl/TRDRNA2_/TRDRNA2_179117_c0_seq1.p1  ORF type:complete len:610 (+),score=123.44 gnl/TRDRNA2_/TRDRNA2_179117_c0_seq1:84-1913(+)
MFALNAIRKNLASTDAEKRTARAGKAEIKISIVKVKPQPRTHKVVAYGYRVIVDGDSPEMYKFHYLPDPEQPEDLHPGVVPAGFTAGVPVDDQMIYFHTREGAMGPEYQVTYTRADEAGGDEPAYQMVIDWKDDVDAVWVEALQILEESGELSEDALAFLDADPLFLFGIADPATQRALDKSLQVPMLRCIGQRPCLEEWFAYLNADEVGDADYKWVVESFAEVELPPPWTSFKGVGSVVCYLNNDTNETTWKHPYYEYFATLLNHCRRSTREEHIKLRINRVLWAYENESRTDVQHQMPLVSPKYVRNMADILGVELVEEPYMVRTLKTFLKAFSQMYHEGELDTQEVKWCLEIVENERAKVAVSKNLHMENDPADQIEAHVHAQLFCIECNIVASCYCPECADCFCESCFERLHSRGHRASHIPNHIIPCVICKTMPAKLQCTYTRGNYCHECYDKKHKKTLPKFLDLKPLRVDYKSQVKVPGQGAVSAHDEYDAEKELRQGFSKSAPLETVLGEKWHAFYDLRGIRYYYNFESQESMRRPMDELIIVATHDPEAMAAEEAKQEILTQISLNKAPRMLTSWVHAKSHLGAGHHHHGHDHHHHDDHHH